jgi:hypothetical protein
MNFSGIYHWRYLYRKTLTTSRCGIVYPGLSCGLPVLIKIKWFFKKSKFSKEYLPYFISVFQEPDILYVFVF